MNQNSMQLLVVLPSPSYSYKLLNRSEFCTTPILIKIMNFGHRVTEMLDKTD
jgi:hypothetical protein